jgi:NAD(P)-dependent dehydrogenase (short-subunit alcohol dehydrogenase family)
MEQLMARFTDQTVVVTGAASGIGKATALRFGSEEAVVACVDLAADGAEVTAAAIRDAGGKAQAFTCNVSDAASVNAAVDAVASSLGAPHVLCNIAGIGRFVHSMEETLEGWERILAVNLTGTFLMTKACLPHLLENGGNVVNTASTAGIFGQPYSAAYCASKGGVIQLTKSLAWEFIERGVRVNAVAPGGIDTPIINSFEYPEGVSKKLMYKLMSPMGFASAEEVAGVFAFVASPEARYMNGTVVTFDGGMTC